MVRNLITRPDDLLIRSNNLINRRNEIINRPDELLTWLLTEFSRRQQVNKYSWMIHRTGVRSLRSLVTSVLSHRSDRAQARAEMTESLRSFGSD